jgi:hypothetical protein
MSALSQFISLPHPVTTTFHLHGAGGTANPPTLFLDAAAATSSTAKYKDSAAVSFGGGNPWKTIGTWTADPLLSEGTLNDLEDGQVWLGLKNSDDIGTRFDIRVEVHKNGSSLVGSGETHCIQGLTRNPARAQGFLIAFTPPAPTLFNGTTDVLSLTVAARIGTDGAGAFCGGHGSAVGVRLYFDAANRQAQFSARFQP